MKPLTIKCSECNSEDLAMTVFEMKSGIGVVVYSAIKCNQCGMVYPLQELGKGRSGMVNKDIAHSMLRSK